MHISQSIFLLKHLLFSRCFFISKSKYVPTENLLLNILMFKFVHMQETTDIFQELAKLIRAIGLPDALKFIKEARINYYKSPSTIDFVEESVCKEFKITSSRLKDKDQYSKCETRTTARSVCSYMLKEKLLCSPKALSNYLNCSKKQIYNYSKLIKELNPDFKKDFKIIEYIENLIKELEKEFGIKID